MNIHILYISFVITCNANFIMSINSSFHVSHISSVQIVKTCCGNTEAFDMATSNCIPVKGDDMQKTSKITHLLPYLGSWKNKKLPQISHERPFCGYEDYEILESRKKIALIGNYIEISEISRENSNVITSFSFEYFNDYCIDIALKDNTSNIETSLLGAIRIVCKPANGHTKSRVKLCCPFKEIFDEASNSCVKSRKIDAYTILDNVPRYDSSEYNSEKEVVSKHDIQSIFVFGEKTKHNFSIECLLWQDMKIGRRELVLNNDGSINIGGYVYSHKEYCINDIKPNEGSLFSGYSALIQYCQYPAWYMVWVTYVEPILYLVSNLCLLFLMVYTTLNKGSKVFGAMMVAIPFNLLICYLGITVAKIWGRTIQNMSSDICLVNGIVIYFSYLSVMFWLNTLCFDVWSSFHSMRAPNMLRVNVGRFDGFKDPKFKRYALYGWGVPFIITIITLIMQFLPLKYTEGFVTPGFGEQRCFLGSRLTVEWKSKLYYLLIPAGIALLLNVVLFGLFVWNLCCGIWANQSSDPSVG